MTRKATIIEKGRCSKCGKKIVWGILVIRAKLSGRSYAPSRVLGIYCEKCYKLMMEAHEGK